MPKPWCRDEACPALVEKTKEIRRGNRVKLTYEPFQYTFQLKDIEVVPKAAA